MSKADKTQLIQTAVCSIVYGQFSGEYQELFRCPRELDDVDLRGYVNDNRCVLGFENDDTKNGGIDGRKCIGYFRLYFKNGWHGRWFINKKMLINDENSGTYKRLVVHSLIKENIDNYLLKKQSKQNAK